MKCKSKFNKRYLQNGDIIEQKSILGYKRHSPFVDEEYLVIDSPRGKITMKEVDFPILGIGENGESIIMKPEKEYQFSSKKVLEIPLHKLKRKTKFSSGGLFTNLTNSNPLVFTNLANSNPLAPKPLKMSAGSITEDNADSVLDGYNKMQGTIGTVGAGIKSVGSVLDTFIPGAGLIGNVVGGLVEGVGTLGTKLLYGDKVKRAQDLKAYGIYANKMRKQEIDMKNALGYI
jgi:hypothetical protein